MNYNYFKKIIKICINKYFLERKTKVFNLYCELENLTQSVIQNDFGMLDIYHDLILNFINDLILMYGKIIFRELEEFRWQGISLEDQEKIFKYVKDEIISKTNNEFDFLEKEVVELCTNYEYHDYWKNCILKKIEDEKTRKINYLNENININIQKIKIKFSLTALTKKQLKDYDDYGYKCKDKIFIPGTSSIYRSNEIIVNKNKINIGDSLFLLLLRLVVELKKGEGGWVSLHSLYNEHIITDPGKYQIYSNLRSVLKGSLLDKDAKEFIENDGSKNYRLSTHPDFVFYNKEKLRSHKDSQIRKLAEELPDNDK